jgi:hypothetical protein
MAYTPDKRRLITGKSSGQYAVYDVGSGAVVGRFTDGAPPVVAAVAPTGDVAAMGGGGARVVTLHVLVPPVPLDRRSMGDMGAYNTLAGAAAKGDIIVLAVGSSLEVHRRNKAGLQLKIELGDAVGNTYSGLKINNPVAVRPGGSHVAVQGGKVVTCYAVSSGEKTFALDFDSDVGLCWSPTGDLLLVWSYNPGFGTAVFDSSGKELRVLKDMDTEAKISNVGRDAHLASELLAPRIFGAAFSADGRQLATVGSSTSIFVRDTTTWIVTHILPVASSLKSYCMSPCFDPTGEYVAAHTAAHIGAWGSADPGSVVVHRLDGSAAVQRFVGVNAHGALAFSADGHFLFCSGLFEGITTGQGISQKDIINKPGDGCIVVLSRATGSEADWSTALAQLHYRLAGLAVSQWPCRRLASRERCAHTCRSWLGQSLSRSISTSHGERSTTMPGVMGSSCS